jgi:hypothetical protein
MQSTNLASDPTAPNLVAGLGLQRFHLLVARAIQRSGVSYKRQRRACEVISTVLPATISGNPDQHAQEIAAHCLQATKPVYQKPRKKKKKNIRPQRHPAFHRRDTLVVALLREAAIVHLREHYGLHFRAISKRLSLRGPDFARCVYSRACRRREKLIQPPVTDTEHEVPTPGN